jgi:preprotein translocase subunit YajC
MFNFLTEAPAGAGMGSTLIMLAVMFGLMYFMLIRPENKRKKEAEQMRSNLKSGDNVTTIGGVTGVVVDVKEDKFVLETGADRVRIEFAKFALSENHTASARAAAENKKAREQAAKEKAAKKAGK